MKTITTKTTIGWALLLLVVAIGLSNCKKNEPDMTDFSKLTNIQVENVDKAFHDDITTVEARYRYNQKEYVAGSGVYKDGMFSIELGKIPESRFRPMKDVLGTGMGVTITPADAMGAKVWLYAMKDKYGVGDLTAHKDEEQNPTSWMEFLIYASKAAEVSGSYKQGNVTKRFRLSLQPGWNAVARRDISATEKEQVTIPSLVGYKWYIGPFLTIFL